MVLKIRVDELRMSEWVLLPKINQKKYKWFFNPSGFEFVRKDVFLCASQHNHQIDDDCLIVAVGRPKRAVGHKRMWEKEYLYLTMEDRKILGLLNIAPPKIATHEKKPFFGYPPKAVRVF